MIHALLVAALLLAGEDRLEQAQGLLQAGQLDQAAAILQDLLGDGTAEEREVRLLLAEVQVAAGEADAAIETLDALDASDDHEIVLAMGRAFGSWAADLAAGGGRGEDVAYAQEEAAAYLERATGLAAKGDTRAAVECVRIVLYTLGDHDRSLAVADEALDRSPGDGEVLLMRGCAGVYAYWAAASNQDEERGDAAWQRAVDDLLAADAALGTKRMEPWAQLAWLYEQKEQADKAVGAGIKVLKRDPQADVRLVCNLARRYAGEQNWRVAWKALAETVRLRPGELTQWLADLPERDQTALSLSWAAGAMFSSDRETATDILAELCAADPSDADVWNNYGFFCRETRRYEDCLAAYERAIELAPDNPRYLNDCAVILHYYLRRESERAGELYEHALELASSRLANEADLDEATRADLKEALKDAADNLRKLATGSVGYE